MQMFIEKAGNLDALDEQQLRDRAGQFQKKIIGTMTGAQLTTLAFVGMFILTAFAVAASHLFLIPGVLATFGAPLGFSAWRKLHDKECGDEARRLKEAADNRKDIDNLAKQQAEERPQEALVLEAATVVKAPLRFKKNLTPGVT